MHARTHIYYTYTHTHTHTLYIFARTHTHILYIFAHTHIYICGEWGGGREPWERSEAGGVNGNERHLHHSPVSRRSFGRVKWGVTTREDQAWNFSLCFVCGSRPWGTAAFHLCLFILLLKCVECSPVPASFFPHLLTSLQYYIHTHIYYIHAHTYILHAHTHIYYTHTHIYITRTHK